MFQGLCCPCNKSDFNHLEVYMEPPFSEYATRYIQVPELKIPETLCSPNTVPVILETHLHPVSTLPQAKNAHPSACRFIADQRMPRHPYWIQLNSDLVCWNNQLTDVQSLKTYVPEDDVVTAYSLIKCYVVKMLSVHLVTWIWGLDFTQLWYILNDVKPVWLITDFFTFHEFSRFIPECNLNINWNYFKTHFL